MAKKAKPAEIPREGVNTRITRELRDKLDQAALDSGRSVGSEIERRLEQSFRFREELLALFGDERTMNALSAIAIAWRDLESVSGRPWYNDLDTLIAAQSAAEAMVGHIQSSTGETITRNPSKVAQDKIQALKNVGMLVAERTRRRRLKENDALVQSAIEALSDGTFWSGNPRDLN